MKSATLLSLFAALSVPVDQSWNVFFFTRYRGKRFFAPQNKLAGTLWCCWHQKWLRWAVFGVREGKDRVMFFAVWLFFFISPAYAQRFQRLIRMRPSPLPSIAYYIFDGEISGGRNCVQWQQGPKFTARTPAYIEGIGDKQRTSHLLSFFLSLFSWSPTG